jgi:thiol peroxidase
MAAIQFKGQTVHTVGNLPTVGTTLPNFNLVKCDLMELQREDLVGKRVIFNIFPSLDTVVCAASVRKFNSLADKLPNLSILCVSMDLPFAQMRFCVAEGFKSVIPVSGFRSSFGKDFGVLMTDGLLAGLYSRAIICCNTDGRIVYNEQVSEITEEPHYDKALGCFG